MHRTAFRRGLTLIAFAALAALLAAPAGAGTARISTDRYIVLFAGQQKASGFQFAQTRQTAFSAIQAAGGSVVRDLSREIGTVVVESPSAGFAETLEGSGLVSSVGADFSWRGVADDAPPAEADPVEALQWDMKMIRAHRAHNHEKGKRRVDVGILDTGIDATHPDFTSVGPRGPNVDCERSYNAVELAPGGPGVGSPDPCVDNGFHGTHVAGTVAAQDNGVGIVGVAPG